MLRELLGDIRWLGDWQVEPEPLKAKSAFDLVTCLTLPGGGRATLLVECKLEPRPQFFYEEAQRRRRHAESLFPGARVLPALAAPRVSPRLGELCRAHGWGWFDLAGNCQLDVSGLLHIERTGRPLGAAPRSAKASLSTPEAGRVVRALLAPENAGSRWTQRALMTHVGATIPSAAGPVSLGLVNKVVRHLRAEAYLEEGAAGFRVRDPLGLLRAWRGAYRFGRHRRRDYFTLLSPRQLRAALKGLEATTGGLAAYAAFSAADFQAPHVRQAKTWLYVAREHEAEFRRAAEAKVVDSGANVVVLLPEDPGVFYLQEGTDGELPHTNAVQTYVDLFHCGSRGEEAAEALLEQRLKPFWKLALPLSP